ncbi:MAG: dihydrofolate reductase family protein [Chloroflexia bacterium]
MPKVIGGMTISLDGFINDRHGDVSRLYPDLPELAETGLLQESMRTTGAVVMGRRTYEMGNGDYTGYEYQVPIFVITHEAPAQAAKGENDKLSFTFVTGGPESAVEQAKAAAGEQDVVVVGGASTTQQCMNAGLLDELQVGIMPVLLGDGQRLFERLEAEKIELARVRTIEGPAGRIDLVLRVVK